MIAPLYPQPVAANATRSGSADPVVAPASAGQMPGSPSGGGTSTQTVEAVQQVGQTSEGAKILPELQVPRAAPEALISALAQED
ncbi:hypothetical protein [Pontivivens insulae]|uniref:Uncharacterized protein n=1 Tax=Pontivivens insulae TaxID=1639689 RepID=A0A2R8A6K1_9RHOB|nr:hypothetical protein [Pontivivens insulae]RED17964.1 hypothetical protein DFR53_0152 [Pontivivens insulae]SPF27853.1 hypothetical protein POI8812_00148 [Pontivivens insulae]